MKTSKIIVGVTIGFVVLVSLFLPIGGTSLYQFLTSSKEDRENKQYFREKNAEYKRNFEIMANSRFKGFLATDSSAPAAESPAKSKKSKKDLPAKKASSGNLPGWTRVTAFVPGAGGASKGQGTSVWLDDTNGLIWSERLAKELAGGLENGWAVAHDLCVKLEPAGYWSLPTVAEFALARKGGAANAWADFQGPWMATFVERAKTLYRPLAFEINDIGDKAPPTPSQRVGIRCVARTERVPAHGFFNDDIDSKDLNDLMTKMKAH